MSRLRAQIAAELQVVRRNGEQLLLTLGIPVLLLAFFSLVDVLPTGTDDPVDFLAPGVLALAVMSTSMVSLGIGTGFERSYHVLKRLGATPLGRTRLIAAKIATVALIEVVQFAVLVPVGYALGWSPSGTNWAAAIGAVLLGGLLAGKSLLGYVFDSAFKLDAEGWRKLTLRWGLFFLFLAVVNEIVWRNFSTDDWVTFKVWGIMPITLIFTFSQMPLIMRHSLDERMKKE